jgi:hypothetical protein
MKYRNNLGSNFFLSGAEIQGLQQPAEANLNNFSSVA